jgi:para-aminobenzoate synthetase component I
LSAAFPGGSITGAPKIRAMQILERLEPVRRGPYTGALGWIGPDGAMATSILIRTFVADGARLTLHVGGGITWGSNASAEWDETVAKARGPLGAIGAHENRGPVRRLADRRRRRRRTGSDGCER